MGAIAALPGLLRLFCVGLLSLGLFARSARAETAPIDVDVELILAVDISYSMDPEEQALQRQGYIQAIRSREVVEAIRNGVNGKIALAYVEWAGSQSQDIIADWQVIDGPEAAEAFAARLAGKPTRRLYRTSISGAIDFAAAMFQGSGFRGLKRVIDISGDGSNNQGRLVTAARDDAVARGIVINGLPIMLNRPSYGYADIEQLDLYYSDCVIGGEGAFVVAIRERAQFAEAIRKKILTEIAANPVPSGDDSRIIRAQTPEPRVSCTIGERLWQQRMGN